MYPPRKSAKIRRQRRPRRGRAHRETTMQISRKRRMVDIGCTLPEYSMEAKEVSNVDLLTEILLYVPGKLLVRFKSVSKHWFSLITDTVCPQTLPLKSQFFDLRPIHILQTLDY